MSAGPTEKGQPKIPRVELQALEAWHDPLVGSNMVMAPGHWHPRAFMGAQTQEGRALLCARVTGVWQSTDTTHYPFLDRNMLLRTNKSVRPECQSQQLSAPP